MMRDAVAAIWRAILAIPMRAWVAAAVIALTWRIIELTAANPSLLQDSSFMQLAGPIAGAGGFLLIVAFLFASSKGEADKSEALRDNARTLNAAGVPVGHRSPRPEPAEAPEPDSPHKPEPEG